MNAIDHVERRDTSGTDKTAGSSLREQQEYADDVKQMNRALDAIRQMHINVSNVLQLLSTIAATAKAQGWTDCQVWPLDIAQTELDE